MQGGVVRIVVLFGALLALKNFIGSENSRRSLEEVQPRILNPVEKGPSTRTDVRDMLTFHMSERQVVPVWDGKTWIYDDSHYRGKRVEVEATVVAVRLHKISKSVAAEVDEVVFHPNRAGSVPAHPNCHEILIKYDQDALDGEAFERGQRWSLILTPDAHLINLRFIEP